MASPKESGISIHIDPQTIQHILSSFHGGKSGPGGADGEQGSTGSGIGSEPGFREGQMWGSRPVNQGTTGTGTGGFNSTASFPDMETQSTGTTGPGPQATFLGRSVGLKSSDSTRTPSLLGGAR